MSLPNWQRTIVDTSGDVVSGAQIDVVVESTGLAATIYSDRAGTTPLTNPFFTASDGFAQFYADPGEYRVTATGPSGAVTWRYEVLPGTAAVMSNGSGGATLGTAAVATLTTGPTDTTSGRVLRIGGNGWYSGNAPNDAAWTSTTTLGDGWTGSVVYKKTLGMVTVSILGNGTAATGNNILTLPVGYRPTQIMYFHTGTGGSDASIGTNGTIALASRTASNRVTLTFPTI